MSATLLVLSVVAELELSPASPLKLPGRGVDGTIRGDREHVRRLLHHGEEPVVIEARIEAGLLQLRAEAATRPAAEFGLARGRFWTGVDDDLTPFLERFADDALIGASIQASPATRPYRRPMPFDVLIAAICEQLIDDERAQEIKRAIARKFGREHDGLRDNPDAARIAALSPAQLEGCGLAAKRATTLIRVAKEVASGRVDLLDPDARAAGHRRLAAIPGVGPWTLSLLALHGQGVLDAIPSGDLAFRNIVGELQAGRRGVKADPVDVAAFFEPYRPWRGVAAWHLLRISL